VRTLKRATVQAPEITAFHQAIAMRDDGSVWTLAADGTLHRVIES